MSYWITYIPTFTIDFLVFLLWQYQRDWEQKRWCIGNIY